MGATTTESNGGVYLYINQGVSIAVGTSGIFEDVVLIDLTATFGAGNEPDKAYMDALLARLFPSTNGWFDGTDTTVIDSDYVSQNTGNFNLIQSAEPAGLMFSQSIAANASGVRTGLSANFGTIGISRIGGTAPTNPFDDNNVAPWSQIQPRDYQLYSDASGTEISGAVAHMVYIPKHYCRFHSPSSSDPFYRMQAQTNPFPGSYPYHIARDGHIPSGILVGAYGLTGVDGAATYLASVTGQYNYCNANIQSLFNQSTGLYSKMAYINIGTSAAPVYKQLRPMCPYDVFCDIWQLMVIEGGKPSVQGWLGQGLSQDTYLNMNADLLSHNATTAVNYVVIPTSNTILTNWLSPSVYNQSTICFFIGGNLWTQRNVTAKEALTSDTGYTKITFDGDPITWKANAGYYISANAGSPDGGTDSLPSGSGIGGASRDGFWPIRWRYIENPYAKQWNVLDDMCKISVYADGAAKDTMYIYRGGTYSPSGGSWMSTGKVVPGLSAGGGTGGWLQTLQSYRGNLIPATYSGATYGPFQDYYSNHSRSSAGTSYYEVLAGGSANVGGSCGFYINLNSGWGDGYIAIGARPFLELD